MHGIWGEIFFLFFGMGQNLTPEERQKIPIIEADLSGKMPRLKTPESSLNTHLFVMY